MHWPIVSPGHVIIISVYGEWIIVCQEIIFHLPVFGDFQKFDNCDYDIIIFFY